MTMKRLLVAACLMVVIGSMSIAASEDYVSGRRDRPHPGSEPDQVFFLFYILDIDAINAQAQNFAINMFVRLRWKDERLRFRGRTLRGR